MFNNLSFQFPKQQVDAATKAKPDWYANSIDYIIGLGLSLNDRTETETMLNVLHGDLPQEFYKKTLNPYNATNERFKRFPATLRNYDIMSDIIRRYIGEYFKGTHDFAVGANNPDIVFERNQALKEKVMQAAQQAFQQEFERKYKEAVEQAQGQGQSPESINPQEVMPDPEEFIAKFNQDYIDKESKQGQDILNYIRDLTNDAQIYLTAFFNYCSLGECYTYTELRGNKIIKECVPAIEAFPIPNNQFMVEDHDMFARRIMMSYNQILDVFEDDLTDKDKSYLDNLYNTSASASTKVVQLGWNQLFEKYPNVCSKFTDEERKLYKSQPLNPSVNNSNLYEVWHVVWKGFARQGILTYTNQLGFQEQRIVEEDYEFNPEAGDIDIEWKYKTQVYEGYRIGTRYNGIYPVKARPILYERKGKLPYNGIQELLPYCGKFSIIQIITPFQVLRNIISYHQEMVIAKNKMLILLLPKSLVASETEDAIYRMAADGVLPIDDEEDAAGVKMQNIRLLNANMGQYITELSNLNEAIKQEARELVDMNAQRYGQIAQSAGASTTQNAISQSSTGSVLIFQMFDLLRCADYNRDLDFAKCAYVEGLETSYIDKTTGKKHYLSLDVNSFVNSDYSTTVRNNGKEMDKIQQLKQWAFSAAQNGDLESALAAIQGDNVAAISDNIRQFSEIRRQHDEQMKQMDQAIQEQANQMKLQEISAKGDQDRQTLALKAQYDLQLEYAKGDIALLGDTNPQNDDYAKNQLAKLQEESKKASETAKLQLERQKIAMDAYNKAADRQVKREEMANQLKIAKTNKNKYDKK
nr:MAG TPA: portal protein [Crassvirales sp.]